MPPPAKPVQPAAALPSVAPAAAEESVLRSPPISDTRATVVDSAADAQTPPAPLPPTSQCSCDTTSYAEQRSANASFTNTSISDPRLLNATTNPTWTPLYVVPSILVPNNTLDFVFFQAQINFSHPVQFINSAQIRLYTNALSSVLQSVAPELAEISAPACTGGFVLPAPPFSPEPDATITAVYETSDCQTLVIRGFAPLLAPLATNSTQLVLDLSSSSVVDACGERFPGTSITTSIRSRQVAELYALGLAYTPRLGPTTDAAVTKMAAVFTQVVPDIAPSFFTVTGPKRSSISKLRLVPGSQSYYAFSVTVSDGYYGTVNVTMTQAAAEQVLHSNSTIPFVSFQKLAVQC